MAKDHFQDIIPPDEAHGRGNEHVMHREDYEDDTSESITMASSDKSIRNINITRRAAPADPGRVAPRRMPSRMWLWILASLCILVLAVLAILYMFSHTTVTVVPHTQPVVFDQTIQFTAYPTGAASSTLQYTVETSDFESSQAVTSSGTTHQETKASGTVTVVNDYSASPVKLLKTTRFQTASGLVFRAPEAVEVPGKQGSALGKVSITIVADGAGQQYNIAPGQRLTLPGLQSNATMYAGVYATTAASTTGGFAGDAPSVSDADVAAARAAIRAKLQAQAADFAASKTDAGVALKPVITFTDEAPVSGQGTQVQVGESAHVVVPILPKDQLAMAVAQTVTGDASTVPYTLVPGSDFAASQVAGDQLVIGTDPVTFSMSGTAKLLAIVDTDALAQALQGRDATAFESIVRDFPGIDSAHARIEPFWNNTFPKAAKDIRITVEDAKK